jgi:hypothetical protein
MLPALPEPGPLGTLRYFGWLVEGRLARGEQPLLDNDDLALLRRARVTDVLSLREAVDTAKPGAGRPLPAYQVEEEATRCAALGLGFTHLPCADYAAPAPEELAAAVRSLDRLVDAGRAVFVHCAAGMGRTSVVTAAWLLSRGWSGDQVAGVHERWLLALDAHLRPQTHEERLRHHRQVGRPGFWWALRAVAAALGSPVSGRFATYDEIQALTLGGPPAGAEGWDRLYAEALAPWRARLAPTLPAAIRPGTPGSAGGRSRRGGRTR